MASTFMIAKGKKVDGKIVLDIALPPVVLLAPEEAPVAAADRQDEAAHQLNFERMYEWARRETLDYHESLEDDEWNRRGCSWGL